MKWSNDYIIDQIDTPEGHLYVVKDKSGKILLRVPGITSRINEYFGRYQNDFPAAGVNYLKSFSISEIEQKLKKRPTPIPGSRIHAGVGDALYYRTGMNASQMISYLNQRKALEAGTVVHEELQEAIHKGTPPTHPKARQLWDNFTRKFPPSRYSYESEVPVTDMKKWGTSIDVIVTDKRTGAVGIYDWKTGHEHAPEHRAQLTKEAQMYEMMTGKKVQSLGVIYPGKVQSHPTMEAAEVNKIFNVRGSTFKKYASTAIADDRPYNVQLADKYLKQLRIKPLPAGADLRNYSNEVTFLDTETGHGNQILQIGAVKGRINYKTGLFEYTDTFERYYYPLNTSSKEYRKAQQVHHIDVATQRQYRRLQNAQYGATYGDVDREALMAFIGDSAVAGHAILQSDLPWLGLDKIKNSIYDTYESAKYVYKNEVSYGLENLYNKHIGRRREYHQAFIDALMNAQFGGKMSLRSRRVQWVLNNMGFATYPYDQALEGTGRDPFIGRSGPRTSSMGGNIKDYWQGGNMGSDDDLGEEGISAFDYDVKHTAGMGLDTNINSVANMTGGSGWSELFQSMTGAITHMDSYAKTVNDMSKNLSESITGYNFSTRRRMMHNIVHSYAESDWDAALSEELGIGQQDLGTWHSRLAGIRSRENFKAQLDAENRVQNALGKGLISQAQADTIQRAAKSVDDLNDALDRQIKHNDKLRQSIESMQFYDLNQLHQTAQHQWSGIKGAARGVVPAWFAAPAGRFGDAFMNVVNRGMARYNAGMNIMNNVVSPVMGMAGAALGSVAGPGGAMGGYAIGKAVAAGLSQIMGNSASARMAIKGERIQEVFNLYGGMLDIITMPVKMLGRVIKTVVRLLGMLAGAVALGIRSMKSLATPLTNLTGVNFPMQQGLEAAGYMTGLGKEAYGNAYNSFATESQALYATGQVNRNRLVAASMLGVFGDVYNPTADADVMYGNTVNKILSQLQSADPTRRKQIMTLAGRIDSTLPQTLQVMSDLGVSDWSQMRTYSGYAYFRPHTDAERTLYRKQSFQAQGNVESMMNSFRRIASKLWTVMEPFVGAFNKFLDAVATTFQKMDFKKPGEALKFLKDQLFGGWKDLKGKIDFGFINNAIKKVIPVIIDAVAAVAKFIVDMWGKIIKAVIDKGDMLLAYLSSIRIDWKALLKGDWDKGIQIGTGKDKRSTIYDDWYDDLQFYDAKGKRYVPTGIEMDETTGKYFATKEQLINAVMVNRAAGGHIVGRGLPLSPRNEYEAEYAVDATVGTQRLSDRGFLGENKFFMKGVAYGGDTGQIDAMNIANRTYQSYGKNIDLVDNATTVFKGTIEGLRVAARQQWNTVDINIGVNDKPGWKIEAGPAGVEVVENRQRFDIGGMYINATINTLEQKGRSRAGGGN